MHYLAKLPMTRTGRKQSTTGGSRKTIFSLAVQPAYNREDSRSAQLCDRFLVNRRGKMESNELTLVSLQTTCNVQSHHRRFRPATRLVSDLDASDFEHFRRSMAKGWSPVTLANEIQRIRVVFRYGTENHFVTDPIRYGSEFKKPSKKVLRAKPPAKGSADCSRRTTCDGSSTRPAYR